MVGVKLTPIIFDSSIEGLQLNLYCCRCAGNTERATASHTAACLCAVGDSIWGQWRRATACDVCLPWAPCCCHYRYLSRLKSTMLPLEKRWTSALSALTSLLKSLQEKHWAMTHSELHDTVERGGHCLNAWMWPDCVCTAPLCFITSEYT